MKRVGTRSSWSPILASLRLRLRLRLRLCLLTLVLAPPLVIAGCTSAPGPPPLPAPGWHEVTLPVAGTGRPEVAALAACPGHWYAAGGYRTPDGATSPALWASPDGRAWRPVPTRPVSAYGPRHLLSAVACRGDTVVAVGSAAGGVHGNPRTATWLASGTGPLTEVPAAFELYGGPAAIGVGRLTAGPGGWLLCGARLDANGQPGAAVWPSVDGREFRLVDADPELESDARGQTSGVDVLAAQDGFTLVGSVFPLDGHAARAPLAWTSGDGVHWHRVALPAPGEDAELQRAVPDGDGLLVLGIRGAGFGVWRASGSGGDPAGWRTVSRFGAFHGTGLPGVTALATSDGRAYAVVADGERYQLWASGGPATDWTRLPLPVQPTVGEGHQVALVGAGDAMLLAVEDGTATRVWTSRG